MSPPQTSPLTSLPPSSPGPPGAHSGGDEEDGDDEDEANDGAPEAAPGMTPPATSAPRVSKRRAAEPVEHADGSGSDCDDSADALGAGEAPTAQMRTRLRPRPPQNTAGPSKDARGADIPQPAADPPAHAVVATVARGGGKGKGRGRGQAGKKGGR